MRPTCEDVMTQSQKLECSREKIGDLGECFKNGGSIAKFGVDQAEYELRKRSLPDFVPVR